MALTQLPDGSIVDVPQTGLIGSEQALQGGLQGALSAVGRGADIAGGVLQPFAGGGAQAFQQQAALSGAAGPQAQQEAFASFQASPGQAFLREQGEQRGKQAAGGGGGPAAGRAPSLPELQ